MSEACNCNRIPKATPEMRELFYKHDVLDHQKKVAEIMAACAKILLERAEVHDNSKLSNEEKMYYIDPVWELNQEGVQFGSMKYEELIATMGKGLEHHLKCNDHHIEHFENYTESSEEKDPIKHMTLFNLMEMLCDWSAAASRKCNAPEDALERIVTKYPMDPQLYAILENTLRMTRAKLPPNA